MLAWEKFTGRVEILRELDSWVKNIQRMGSPSTALIALRRMGKTVLLDRLINTVFYLLDYEGINRIFRENWFKLFFLKITILNLLYFL